MDNKKIDWTYYGVFIVAAILVLILILKSFKVITIFYLFKFI